MTVAAFMELALYHPEHGYYASRARRSGRAGDFYTSVDVGPIFGEMLAVQVAAMLRALGGDSRDLVEAAAGNGRLMRDILDSLQRDAPAAYARVRVHLVERSAEAREAQLEALGSHAAKIAWRGAQLPSAIDGVLFANELLDAFPVHLVVRRGDDLREVMVDVEGDRLVEREGLVSSDPVRREIAAGPPLPAGVRVEVNLEASRWMREAAARLQRGFVLIIDYGDEAEALRSPMRREGTLRAFRGHQVSGRWLDAPGEQDLTAHVDFTALTRAARAAGLEPLQRAEQAKWLLDLGLLDRLQQEEPTLPPARALRRRLAAKTLLVPGGIGATHTVLVFRKR